MISRLHCLFPLLCFVACERSAVRQTTDSTATASTTVAAATQNVQTPPPISSNVEDSVFDTFGIDSPDSSYGAWDRDGFVSGDHVRHPSGLMILWLDTAVRATDGRPARRAHADSIVITGLDPSEGLGHFCNGPNGAGPIASSDWFATLRPTTSHGSPGSLTKRRSESRRLRPTLSSASSAIRWSMRKWIECAPIVG